MTRTFPVKKIVRILVVILFFAAIIGYGLSRGRDVLFGIRLYVEGAVNGQSVTTPILSLTGTAIHATSVTVDGQLAQLSEDGSWKDTFALLPGYNPITITATDKFKKSVSKKIVVYYKAPPPPLVPDPTADSLTIPPPPETSGQSGTKVQ